MSKRGVSHFKNLSLHQFYKTLNWKADGHLTIV